MATFLPPGDVVRAPAGYGVRMEWDGRRLGRRAVQAVVALVSVALLVTTGYGWALYQGISDDIVTSDALGDRPPARLDEEFTALLVGIDSRTDSSGDPLPPAVLDELRAGGDEGQFNTDTIILLHVPAGTRARASAVSIPRDSFVELAGDLGTHKINSAYRRGMAAAEESLTGLSGAGRERVAREAGRRALLATVEDLTGVTVDHFAEINLAGFVEFTDAVGGVPVCLNAAVQEERSGIDLAAGRQVVDGGDALAFVRQRRDLDGGDLDRVTRQQAFLAGLARTALTPGTLADPARLDRLLDAVTRYVVLDRGWDLDLLVGQLRRASGSDIAFRTIPTGRPDLATPVDGVAVEIDPEQVRAFVTGIVDGEPERRENLAGPPAPGASPTAPTSATTTPTQTPGATSDPGAAPGEPITADAVPCVD